ncbi:MAG: Alpha-galactosidase A precursor [Firmicutes bacterium ADurb.Bin262]|nr:MAG: Alpha-galactosidase A precursor [Firmicutes bacterium ADurb.Bin262]
MTRFMKTLLFSAAAAGAAVVGIKIKNKRLRPANVAKTAAGIVKLNIPVTGGYNNGAALTPPMGWSSWNTFRNKIDEDLILETARAIKASGLADAGYVYVNIDDCWQSSMRDADGRLQGDLVHFKSGIKALAEKVNALGLKLGIYTSNGTLTCEDLPASLGYEQIDAETFAEWGIEYFKYDFCHNVPIPMRAPYIEKITVSREGTEIAEFGCDEGILSGNAYIIDDDKLESGKFVAGLSANCGAIEFPDISAPEDGEYVLTLAIRKKSNSNKYAEILVNGKDVYKTIVPPTRSFSAQGRHQVAVKLRKGGNSIKIYNPVASRQDSAALQYTAMGEHLKQAAERYAEKHNQPVKPIVYSICEWGINFPWRWGRHAGNLWRTTPDIKPFWASVLAIYEINVNLYKYAGPGAWNDPDMLEVGNGNLTYEENKSHFTLWCMMAAPLILGNDIRKLLNDDMTPDENNSTLRIITNKDVIAVDQDPLGVQCRRLKTNGIADTLVKPLSGNEVALCFFNKGGQPRRFEQNIAEIVCQMYVDLPYTDSYEVVDLWDKSAAVVEGMVSAEVPSHGVKIYKIKARG